MTELVLFLDLNEIDTGVEPTNNYLDKLDVVLNPTGTPDPSGDVISAQQNGIDQSYSGGSLPAELAAGSTPVKVDTVVNGSGQADYAIFTGINPFDLGYAATDIVLFNVPMSGLSNGSEFLAATYPATKL
ncbi:MAG: hypothetical protein KDA61_02625 [Planctomycetales bacterium]|nr:hypothetical protein [Planctomycetales bacterium]